MRRLLPLIFVFALAPHVSAQTPPLKIAITIDDLPAHAPMPPGETRLGIAQSFLKTLKKEKLPPVYGFINARKIERAPEEVEVLRAWKKAGEPLGNHTYAHLSLEKVSVADYEQDIAKNESMLKQYAPRHTDWHWFRYPFLHEGETLEKRQQVQHYLIEHGYKTAEVTIDFEDYLWNDGFARCSAKHDKEAIAWLESSYLSTAADYVGVFRKLAQQIYGRDISYVLLMHIGAFDARMLPRLIAQFRAEGFTFTTLADAQSDPAYAEDPAIGYPGGGALLELIAAKRKIDFPNNTKPYKKLDEICR